MNEAFELVFFAHDRSYLAQISGHGADFLCKLCKNTLHEIFVLAILEAAYFIRKDGSYSQALIKWGCVGQILAPIIVCRCN